MRDNYPLPTTAVKETMIERELNLLEKEIERASELTARTSNRISKILSPDTPSQSACEEQSPLVVEFAERVRSLRSRLSGSLDYLENIIERVEL